MKDTVVQWLQDGDEQEAAKILSECTIDLIFVDILFEMTGGERTFEMFDVNIGASRKVLIEIDSQLKPYKNQIEKAIREVAQSINSQIRDIAWVPKVAGTEKVVESQVSSGAYVELTRINELKAIRSEKFDVARLIALCEELNICYANDCNQATIMLTRAIVDHVPPIFGVTNFAEVANNYGGSKSFRQSMEHLEKSSRKIADSYLHGQIRSKESLPTRTQINFSNDLDVLLAEIIRILK